MARVNIDLAIRLAGAMQRFFRSSGHRRGAAEHSHDGRALCAAILDKTAEDVVGGDSSLAVRGSGERYLGRAAGNDVFHLDGVTDRIDVRVAGLQVFVDTDAAARADVQTGVDRQLVFRPDTHAENDHLGG